MGTGARLSAEGCSALCEWERQPAPRRRQERLRFTRVLLTELVERRIQGYCVAPGVIEAAQGAGRAQEKFISALMQAFLREKRDHLDAIATSVL